MTVFTELLTELNDIKYRLSRLERKEPRQRHIHAGASRELTISGGAITVRNVDSHIRVDTQNDDASDDLDTITGGTDGQTIILRTQSNDRDVTIKHATDNIRNFGSTDITLGNRFEFAIAVYDSAGSFWMVHQ